MFIEFAGTMININYIINVYKSVKYIDKKNDSGQLIKKAVPIIVMKYNNITEVCTYVEYYNSSYSRNLKFNELVRTLNNWH